MLDALQCSICLTETTIRGHGLAADAVAACVISKTPGRAWMRDTCWSGLMV